MTYLIKRVVISTQIVFMILFIAAVLEAAPQYEESESNYDYDANEDSLEVTEDNINKLLVSATPLSNNTLGCILPETPSNGRYAVINQPGAAVPGRAVATYSLLLYSCDEGFSNSLGEPFTECRRDGTWSSAPECKLSVSSTPAPPKESGCPGSANLGCLLGGLLRNLSTPCEGGCTLPALPAHGGYSVVGSEVAIPGTTAKHYTVLLYFCDRGYNATEQFSVCQTDNSWSEMPTCVRSNPTLPCPTGAPCSILEELKMPSNPQLPKSEEVKMRVTCPPLPNPTYGWFKNQSDSRQGEESLETMLFLTLNTSSVNQTFGFLCNFSFVASTNATTCLSNGKWSETPVCYSPCKTPPISDSLEFSCPPRTECVSQISRLHGSHMQASCKEGFSSFLEDNQMLTCRNGSWDNVTLNCIKMEEPTTLKSGSSIFEADDTTKRPTICPPLPNPLNGWFENQSVSQGGIFLELNTSSVNQTFNFFCDTPYIASTNATTCLSNGKWSEIPVCYSPCEIPPPSDSLEFSCPLRTECDLQLSLPHGSHILANCKEGFYSPLEIKNQMLTCRNGSWNSVPLDCEKIEEPITSESKSFTFKADDTTTERAEVKEGCQVPKKPWGGGYILLPDNITNIQTEKLAVFSTLEYYCDNFMYDIFPRFSTCMDNNRWSESPSCYKYCDLLPSETLDFECINSACNWAHGSTVNLFCKNGYSFLPDTIDTLECNNGSWNYPLPECTQISTTPKSLLVQNQCELPPQPENGEYVVTSEGNYYNELRFFCNENYSSPITASQCVDNQWTEMAACSKNCEMVSSNSVNFECSSYLNQSILCETSLPHGTILVTTCKMGHYPEKWLNDLTCNNGSWNNPVPECKLLDVEIGEDAVIFCHRSSRGQLKFDLCRNFSRSMLDQPTFSIGESWSLLDVMPRPGQDDTLGLGANLSSGCLIPSEPRNGYILAGKEGRVPVSSVVWYVCYKGYENASDITMICQKNGNWSSLPKCRETYGSCRVPIGNTFTTDCTYQPLEMLKAIDQCKGSMPHGAYLISTCIKGYHIGITNTSVKIHICNNGSWSYPIIECIQDENKEETIITTSPIPVTTVSPGCLVPSNPHNGYVKTGEEKSFPEASVISYSCYKDYKNASDTRMVCQKNGTWTSIPECIDEHEPCRVPSSNTFTTDCAYQPLNRQKAIDQCEDSMPHGSYLVSTCKRGYNRPTDTIEKNHTCHNRRWSPPIFECAVTQVRGNTDIESRRITPKKISSGCPLPPAPSNGSYTVPNYPDPVPGDLMEHFTILTFTCIWYSQPTVNHSYCRENNEWTELAKCIIPEAEKENSGCELPSFPKNGHYSPSNLEKKLVPGRMAVPFTVLLYSCDKNHDMSTESVVSVCLKNNTWSNSPVCYKRCDLKISYTVKHICYTSSHSKIPCNQPLPHGSRIHSSCKPGHVHRTNLDIVTCQDGRFDNKKPICKPVCGLEKSFAVKHMVNAPEVMQNTFPWHVGIYQLDSRTGTMNQICGGSIIHVRLVISAAHCFYDDVKNSQVPAKYFRVAAGKFYNAWDHKMERNRGQVQKSEVFKILLHDKYGGSEQHYQDDVAVVILKKPLDFTNAVQAVCYDLFDEERNRYQLAPNNIGKVAGWGLTEKQETSNELRTLNLPVVERSVCTKELSKYHYTGFLTSDKFCAGLLNGSAVCQGDSGGGLVFPEKYTDRDRWYLRGVVSNGPLNENKTSCRPNTFTAFTEIFSVRDWLRKVITPLIGY